MSELGTRLDLIRTELAAKYPLRSVRREFLDFMNLSSTELAQGVYTILSGGESDLTNVAGYVAQDGKHSITILAQIQMPAAAGEEATGLQVEEAELTMVDEIKAFCRTLSASLCLLSLKGWRQSMQTERPFGFVVFDLEYTP